MAEAAVVVAITSIATGLAQEGLKKGSCLVCGWCCQVRAQFHRIQEELEMMRAFLLDAERRAEEGEPNSSDPEHRLETWIRDVQEAAFEAEDIIDEFSYLFAKGKRYRGGQRRGSWRWAAWASAVLPNAVSPRPWISLACKLSGLDSRLRHLKEMKDGYNIDDKITASDQGAEKEEILLLQRATEAARLKRKEDVVGIEGSGSMLTQWLINGDDEPALTLISVWGMGGVGKTTLVDQVYKSHAVREHFALRGWVSVSQTYKVEDLLRRLIKDMVSVDDKILSERVLHEIGAKTYGELAGILHDDLLGGRRFLVVLDDVWEVEAWEEIRAAIHIDEELGSRVVFTSRRQDVARLAARDRDMHLHPLQDEAAWALFCQRAFDREPGRSCPPDLLPYAREIVNKCQGLPLAIVNLGAMMSVKGGSRLTEWRKICEQLIWYINHDRNLGKMKTILSLSLKELPRHLRGCLLYCSAFPEDFPVKRKKLIRLWVAEGLINADGRTNMTLEEVAEEYLNQLVIRSMLEVADTNESGRVKLIRMHDVVRDLIVSIATTKKFFKIYDGRPGATVSDDEHVDDGDVRRLSIQREPGGDDIQSLHEAQTRRLRSLLILSSNAESWSSSPSLLSPSRWKLLRVLDLEDLPIESLPDAVYGLLNLRHLGLRNTKVSQLSNSIRRLVHLETLDLYSAKVRELPAGVTELKKLRHLFLTGFDGASEFFSLMTSTVPAPKGICNLKDLQTLQFIDADDDMVRHLHNLTRLSSVWITGVRRSHCEHLCAAFTGMPKLHRLSMCAEDSLDLAGLCPPPPLLERLGLVGSLAGGLLPTWFGFLPNLAFLELDGCRLNEDQDPVRTIATASPNLAYLGLYGDAYMGRRLCFPEGCFNKLTRMNLSEMNQLRQVEIGEGALLSLRHLQLYKCPELKEVPRGIERVPLQEMLLPVMPEQLLRSLKEDPTKIRHIPNIRYAFMGDDGRSQWVDLGKQIR